MRLIVPDAERYLRAYVEEDRPFLEEVGRGVAPKMAVINKVFRERGFHKYAYDYEVLKQVLEHAGFRDVRRCGFRGSPYNELNIDLDERPRRIQSLYVEAVR